MRILSFGNNPKLEKDSIFVALWESFQSLNFFVRVYILTGILIVASTPFIVANRQIFNPRAAETPAACITPYEEGSGIVTFEAENFHANKAMSSNWVLQSDIAGSSGSKFMIAEPDAGVNNNTAYAANSPMLSYRVSFTTPGTYHVWVRGYSINGSSDSVHVGLDGKEISTSDRINSFNANSWTWHKNTSDGNSATLSITPGEHIINVWMREDGFRFDKIILTTDSSFVPSGISLAESQCVPPSELTPTPTPSLSPVPNIPSDVNQDGCVDILDFSLWLTAFKAGIAVPGSNPDINRDGRIDLLDFNEWFVAMRTGVDTCL